nr:MAG TPA: hypothetical protein [Caudoviricetes sp.]
MTILLVIYFRKNFKKNRTLQKFCNSHYIVLLLKNGL